MKPILLSLDTKGRCCGRKPIFYKGGSWRSPVDAPLYHCCECSAEFWPDGHQRANFAWEEVAEGFVAKKMDYGANAKARAKHKRESLRL